MPPSSTPAEPAEDARRNYHKVFRRIRRRILFPPSILSRILPHLRGNILDIGTGDGYKLSRLLRLVPSQSLSSATAIEPSRLAEEARRHLAGIRRTTVVRTSWERFSRRRNLRGRFDAVLAFEIIEHLSAADQRLFLETMRRLLKPTGVLILSTPNRPVYRLLCRLTGERPDPTHIHELTPTELRRLLDEAGFHPRLYGFFPFMALVNLCPLLDILSRLWPLGASRTVYGIAFPRSAQHP